MANTEKRTIEGIVSDLSSRLGASGVKEGTFIYSIAKAVLSERDSLDSAMSDVLKNMHLETCTGSYNKLYANDIGLRQISVPYLAVLAQDNIAYLETPDLSAFPGFLNGVVILQKGKSISYGKITVTADEDWVIVPGSNKIFVPCSISSTENFRLLDSTKIKLNIDSEYLRYVNFRMNQQIDFTYIYETENVFKNRIALEIREMGNRDPGYLESYVESIFGVREAKIDDSSSVPRLFFTTSEMYEYGEDISTEKYRNIIDSEMSRILTWPNRLTVIPTDKTTMHCSYKIIGARKSTQLIVKDSLLRAIKATIDRDGFPEKETIETIVGLDTGENIKIADFYVLDSISDSEIYDWSGMNDIYIYSSILGIEEL